MGTLKRKEPPPIPTEAGSFILSDDGSQWLLNSPAVEAITTEADAAIHPPESDDVLPGELLRVGS